MVESSNRGPSETDKTVKGLLKQFPTMTRPKSGAPEANYTVQLKVISLIVGMTALLAFHAVLPPGDWTRNVQVGFYGAAIGFVSWLGNAASFRRGALLSARGDALAKLGVPAWFVLFGVMVGTLTFTAVSYKYIENTMLREAGQNLAGVSRTLGEAGAVAKSIVPGARRERGRCRRNHPLRGDDRMRFPASVARGPWSQHWNRPNQNSATCCNSMRRPIGNGRPLRPSWRAGRASTRSALPRPMPIQGHAARRCLRPILRRSGSHPNWRAPCRRMLPPVSPKK